MTNFIFLGNSLGSVGFEPSGWTGSIGSKHINNKRDNDVPEDIISAMNPTAVADILEGLVDDPISNSIEPVPPGYDSIVTRTPEETRVSSEYAKKLLHSYTLGRPLKNIPRPRGR